VIRAMIKSPLQKGPKSARSDTRVETCHRS
jgi:hypothetical protein